jgi:hypothetical protein
VFWDGPGIGERPRAVVGCAGGSTAIDPHHRPRLPLLDTIGVDEPNVVRAMPDGSHPESRGERPSHIGTFATGREAYATARRARVIERTPERVFGSGCDNVPTRGITMSAGVRHYPKSFIPTVSFAQDCPSERNSIDKQ